jgi:hypothetical protein
MVVRLSATPLVPTLVVPDEQTWTMGGRDPAALGLEPVFAAGRVQRVLVPDRIPDGLVEPLDQLLDEVPEDVERPTVVREPVRGGHGGHDAHEEHGHDMHGHDDARGGHDHHAMMAIVGEPSADGLVMEPLELRFGPIATPLPGGLIADVTLDGDVVAECRVSALLEAENGAPDPLAPQAYETVLAAAAAVPPSERWGRIARLEVERALSHMAWLRAFARALGWPTLVEQAQRGVSAALAARRLSEPALGEAASVLADVARFVGGSRLLRWRTEGRAPLDSVRARELGLRGPIARASGLGDDARRDDPLYRMLGFEVVVSSGGDALARTLVRAREAAQSIALATRACAEERRSELGEGPASSIVEGPRGPLQARIEDGGVHVGVPGHEAALGAAGEAVIGAEWSAAVIGLASFDLSPWRVPG